MASRLLLTLLALLTGLSAQVSPARAGECARAAQVIATAAIPAAARISSVPAELQAQPRRQALGLGVERAEPRDGERIALAAPVLPGIDRAHE